MAALPEWQRQKEGTKPAEEGLDRCDNLGHSRMIVAGHADYSPRYGFVRAAQFGLHAPFSVPDVTFITLALQPDAFADCAGEVEYPPPFEAG